mmetsp:Transcript_77960/g.215547  ORF Transcript_77960/g.215547 Transcript_77960/m.215547 type:complete len:200 (+) Transcript_77960:680-1279(+)
MQHGPRLGRLRQVDAGGRDAAQAAAGPGEAVEDGAQGQETMGVHADDVVAVRPAPPLLGAEVAPLLREDDARTAAEKAPRHPEPEARARGSRREATIVAGAPCSAQRARQRPGREGRMEQEDAQACGCPGRVRRHTQAQQLQQLSEAPESRVQGTQEADVEEGLAGALHENRQDSWTVRHTTHAEVTPRDIENGQEQQE